MNKITITALVVVIVTVVGVLATLLAVLLPQSEQEPTVKDCQRREYSSDSFVCVCDSTYCDTVGALVYPSNDDVLIYTSSRDGMRLTKSTETFQKTLSLNDSITSLTIDTNKRFQKIKGFGGAFTDATGINILSLSQESQENLLRSYFSPDGIEYNVGRIPMASCDFSTRTYTYNDEPSDFELKNFALAMEDFTYKIPLIKRAQEMSSKKISFFGSSWSAPAWMKTSNSLIGNGSLIGEPGNEYHKAWALYYIKFIEAYESYGINMWGLTAQNEPNAGLRPNFPFQCMGFTAEHQRDFIKIDLGPTLRDNGREEVKLMILDGQRTNLPDWADTVLSDPEAAQFVSGVGLHWYTDWLSDPVNLAKTHEKYPDYFMMGTEACSGAMPWQEEKALLGSWVRGERYSMDILEDLNHWVSGWVDWNMALNMEGGPNWVKNFVDAPIIVNSENDEFYKQPIFYHMGHFSKFIPENSTMINTIGPDQGGDLKYAGFIHPNNSTATLIVLNVSDELKQINIVVSEEKYLPVTLKGNSIQTYLWEM